MFGKSNKNSVKTDHMMKHGVLLKNQKLTLVEIFRSGQTLNLHDIYTVPVLIVCKFHEDPVTN